MAGSQGQGVSGYHGGRGRPEGGLRRAGFVWALLKQGELGCSLSVCVLWVSRPHTEKAQRSTVGFDLISCLRVSLGIPPSPHHPHPHPWPTSPRPSLPSPPWKQRGALKGTRQSGVSLPLDEMLEGTSQTPRAGVNTENEGTLPTWKRKSFRAQRAPDTPAARALRGKGSIQGHERKLIPHLS